MFVVRSPSEIVPLAADSVFVSREGWRTVMVADRLLEKSDEC